MPVVWLIDYGWHTEIIVPADQVTGPLAPVRAMFPSARTLSFGFGKQSFMTLANPGVFDLLAGTIPGAATLRVIPLPTDPAQYYRSPITQITLTPAEWAALSDFLWRSFAHAPDGTLIPVPAEPGTGGQYFAATHGYSLAYTCNTWSIDSLSHAGLPTSGSVVFSGSAMRQAALLQGACRPPR
jgi:hypothetical protein